MYCSHKAYLANEADMLLNEVPRPAKQIPKTRPIICQELSRALTRHLETRTKDNNRKHRAIKTRSTAVQCDI